MLELLVVAIHAENALSIDVKIDTLSIVTHDLSINSDMYVFVAASKLVFM